jgi:hypothetical protein
MAMDSAERTAKSRVTSSLAVRGCTGPFGSAFAAMFGSAFSAKDAREESGAFTVFRAWRMA